MSLLLSQRQQRFGGTDARCMIPSCSFFRLSEQQVGRFPLIAQVKVNNWNVYVMCKHDLTSPLDIPDWQKKAMKLC